MPEYYCRTQGCNNVSVKPSPVLKTACPKCRNPLEVSDESGNTYFLKDYRGGGGYGDVYKACNVKDLKGAEGYYAIKFLKNQYNLGKCKEILTREIENLKTAKEAGARVPQHIGFYCPDKTANNSPNDNYFCVQEFIEGEDLQKAFDSRKKEITDDNTCYFKEEEIFKYLIDLLSTICLLHRQDIIHRDIKPSNIIEVKKEEKSQKLYLIDFGSSKDLMLNGQTTNNSITLAYSPPELISGNQQSDLTENKFKFTVDTYSLAITMFYLLTGENENTQRQEHGHESWDNWMIKVKDKAPDLFQILETMSSFYPSKRYKTAMKTLIEVSIKAFYLHEGLPDRDDYLFKDWLLKIALNEFKETKTGSHRKFLDKSKEKEKERNKSFVVQLIKNEEK
jgi:serine/threonine protein kinase